jgi:hypothetical protein
MLDPPCFSCVCGAGSLATTTNAKLPYLSCVMFRSRKDRLQQLDSFKQSKQLSKGNISTRTIRPTKTKHESLTVDFLGYFYQTTLQKYRLVPSVVACDSVEG